MKKAERIVRSLLCLPDWLAALVVFPSFALVISVLASGETGTARALVSYALSAYALLVMLAHIPGAVRAFRSGFVRHPFVRGAVNSKQGQRLLHDRLYRAQVTIHQGLFSSLLYAAVKAGFGIVEHSVWFGVLAGYYLLLSLMRLLLSRHVLRTPAGQNPAGEWRCYRLCGVMLLVMNQALAAVVYRIVITEEGFVYPGLLIYAMAAYTFYAFIIAVVNMVRFRKYASPVLSASKAVSLVSALVSLLSLETAMLAQFGAAKDAPAHRLVISLTGAAICAAVLALAVHMIIKSTRALRAHGS